MSDMGDAPSVPAAELAWCHEAVQGVSRTFALTIELLEEPMSSHVCIGYLICRIPDTVEDAGHIPATEQAAILATYERALDPDEDTSIEAFLDRVDPWVPPPDERNDDWTVVAESAQVYTVYEALPADVREAIRPPAQELVQGMVQFVERYAEDGGLRLRTVEELEEYCHYVAGTVGSLVTNLVCRGPVDESVERRMRRTAESFGLLLQLVNVAKDVHDDYAEENNVYLPADWLAEEGVDQDAVGDPTNRSEVARAVRRTTDHARTFLDDAHSYLEAVPERHGNRLAAWAVPYLLAVGTLRELGSRPEDAVSNDGVKVSRAEVQAIVAATAGADHSTLDRLRDRVADAPVTDPSFDSSAADSA
jgi:farnesyl-diphosphate farnesyltransferase